MSINNFWFEIDILSTVQCYPIFNNRIPIVEQRKIINNLLNSSSMQHNVQYSSNFGNNNSNNNALNNHYQVLEVTKNETLGEVARVLNLIERVANTQVINPQIHLLSSQFDELNFQLGKAQVAIDRSLNAKIQLNKIDHTRSSYISSSQSIQQLIQLTQIKENILQSIIRARNSNTEAFLQDLALQIINLVRLARLVVDLIASTQLPTVERSYSRQNY
ncbi:hypothetical protein CONCODRAFT_11169 [Conidiobolus coronatus NRRL 28638]|uniref:Uncharacterized protein n=1 Tax=Conidiobolus coronatus (strain ATCC 28846 / CBS 209.66 / NRRL 28638) TaxID=796925 RepID=A0A137NW96_CONC2|nr:hypothetical protein CONCODRAFT_11169 [Conidiobolus coronatus NRRL 28638]|eukprot:KXN66884.1 hypothetical protein CONCODRAFT_11169 [Conidiobolus coronatus NRRL 28638]